MQKHKRNEILRSPQPPPRPPNSAIKYRVTTDGL